MVFDILFRQLPAYSRWLFMVIMAVIFIQLFSNVQFARLARMVDNGMPPNKPLLCESFPFVVYHMYSGKMDDPGQYAYFKIIADGREFRQTDLTVLQEDQYINPIQNFLRLKSNNFEDKDLYNFIHLLYPSSQKAMAVYKQTSNSFLAANESIWSEWLKRYIGVALGHPVNQITLLECTYAYDTNGTPQLLSERQLYSSP